MRQKNTPLTFVIIIPGVKDKGVVPCQDSLPHVSGREMPQTLAFETTRLDFYGDI
jgi:hypothetical protein